MVTLLIPIRRLLLLLVLIQSVSLYKIYALDNNPSNLLSDSLPSSYDKEIDQALPIKNFESNYDDDVVFDINNDETNENLTPWLSFISDMKQYQKPSSKRSIFPIKFRSSNNLVQRRNNRPHWNPLVAAYKRCGELSTHEERESCFKDAVQRLFVFKLRK
ncbi:unnamed protein product [Rotaria sp. Silwood2]|nr:unnamed protein product [Rotaria sp. Silwood2]CAF2782641.1 unnamed protein product [Rotaria sp. Silwood2]CAF3047596.1 unnamed protein product [Rotaria sp. Silwood2]CAF3185654.1 unnamed protein product [Rotaria sp. Silwood2]CAF4015470.1 unnamed protein product [Rotaria sp. Silwood2]